MTIVTIIAGQSSSGDSGDGGPALLAKFSSPHSVAYHNGEIYVVDMNVHKIRKILTNGNIITFAGSGSGGFSGDGGLATLANLYFPRGISVSPTTGDVFIADSMNNRIRRVSAATGIISTIAGSGGVAGGFSGDGGPAVAAELDSPYAVVVDTNGDVFIADTNNERIRKVAAVDGIITTVVGSIRGFSGDGGPAVNAQIEISYGISINMDGDWIIADTFNCAIRRVDRTSKIISTIAGDGSGSFSFQGDGGIATSAKFSRAHSASMSPDGTLYIADTDNDRIRMVSPTTGIISTLAGIGGVALINGSQPQLNSPKGLFVIDNNQILFTDGNTIKKITKYSCNEDGTPSPCFPVCFGKLSNDPTVCNSNGTCVGFNNCSCSSSRYGGPQCSEPMCQGIVASDSKVCSQRGVCPSPNTCQCSPNYFGNNCELTTCSGIQSNETAKVCSGKGTCVGFNSCVCENGYSGSNCENFYCFGIKNTNTSSVCSGKGNCTAMNTCSCDPFYYGTECRLFDCYGISNTNSSVCSSNGICNFPNTCNCKSGYYGSNCEMFNCFGIGKNDGTVCSSNGKCIDSNFCSCNVGWVGFNCKLTTCFGFLNSDSANVCNGRGICQSKDVCNCSNGYMGSECQFNSCFGVSSNDSSVCSSNGNCIGGNVCSCKSNFIGTSCSIPVCFGIPSNDSAVCNYGTCTAPNSCTCREGWIGKNCSVPFCIGVLETVNNTVKCITNDGKTETKELIYSLNELDQKNFTFSNKFRITVNLPSTMKDYLINERGLNDSDVVKVISSVSPSSKPTDNGDDPFSVSPVLTISILKDNDERIPIIDLENPIEMHFSDLSTTKDNNALFNFTCMYFDMVERRWRTEGMETTFSNLKMSPNSNTIAFSMSCKTTHLTSFAVIDQNYKKANNARQPEPSKTLIQDNTLLVAVVASTVGGLVVLSVTLVLLTVVIILFIRFRMNKAKNRAIE